MKASPHRKYKIRYWFYNKFTGEEYIRCTGLVYNRLKASQSYYSNLMKRLRVVQANIYGAPKNHVFFKFELY